MTRLIAFAATAALCAGCGPDETSELPAGRSCGEQPPESDDGLPSYCAAHESEDPEFPACRPCEDVRVDFSVDLGTYPTGQIMWEANADVDADCEVVAVDCEAGTIVELSCTSPGGGNHLVSLTLQSSEELEHTLVVGQRVRFRYLDCTVDCFSGGHGSRFSLALGGDTVLVAGIWGRILQLRPKWFELIRLETAEGSCERADGFERGAVDIFFPDGVAGRVLDRTWDIVGTRPSYAVYVQDASIKGSNENGAVHNPSWTYRVLAARLPD